MKTTKAVYLTKEKYLTTKQLLARRDGRRFCKNKGKAGIPVSISKKTVGRVLQKPDLKWTHFQRNAILTKNDLKLRPKFVQKVCCKRAMCYCEIWNIRKPMVLETVAVDLLRSAHYYEKQNWNLISYLFNQFERHVKWEVGRLVKSIWN